MNVDALARLYFFGFVVSTAVAVVLAISLRWHAQRYEWRNRPLILGPIVATAVAGGFFVLFSAIGFYSPPKSCVTCHEMQPEYSAWRRSPHSRVTCLGCHLQATGAAGFVVSQGRALREVAEHFTGAYPSIINRDSRVSQKEMTSVVCERCHDETKLGEVEFGNRVEIEHQPHTRLGITCQTCHNRVAHRGARGFNYLNGVRMMDGCMRCHLPGFGRRIKDETPPTGCSTCHPKGWAVRVFGKPKPSVADFARCRACHRISDPEVVSQFARSELSEEKVTCSDCHRNHRRRFIADPDPGQCHRCHPKVAQQVVAGTHGRGFKHPFKRVGQVRCTFCHKPHRFAIPKTRPS